MYLLHCFFFVLGIFVSVALLFFVLGIFVPVALHFCKRGIFVAVTLHFCKRGIFVAVALHFMCVVIKKHWRLRDYKFILLKLNFFPTGKYDIPVE